MIIGYRTIKTAIGTGCSIAVAQWLGLTFYASAGILTLLCIKGTRKRSHASARARFFACLVGLFCAGVLFELFGYTPWVVIAVLLVSIPANLRLKTSEGIVTSAVIIFHVYSLQRMSMSIVGNELSLIIIGIGFALIVNLYMPNVENQLKKYQKEIEGHYRLILTELSNSLRYHRTTLDEKMLKMTSDLLERAKDLALRDYENHHTGDIHYMHYFEMRARQFDILERILSRASSIKGKYMQVIAISDFLRHLAQAVHSGNTAGIYLDELAAIREGFRQMPLPQSRGEFEARAGLLYISGELERYLQIKKELITD